MNKTRQFRLIILALALALLVSVFAPVSALAADDEAGPVKITIVHTNDVHSRVDSEAYVASLANGKKAAGENVLLLSAGDVLHGQPFATVSTGRSIVDVMNAVGYDALTPGNHDFNYGWSRLKDLSAAMDFPVLAANVSHTYEKELFTPYIIREFEGVKVGIFGLTTPESVTKTNPGNVKYLTFENPVKSARRVIKELELLGVDVIICLSHLGMDEETMPNERSTAIAELGGVDLIIDGHSHHTLAEGMAVRDTLIVQTGSYGENIGVVELTVADGEVSGKAELVAVPTEPTNEFQPDPKVAAVIANTGKAIERVTAEVVATTSVILQGEREDVRSKETNLGNLICDAMLDQTGADIAITNGGGIRASIPAGKVTKGDVLTVLPFGNYTVVKSITGQTLIDALELGLQAYPATNAAFLHVGGINVVFDPSRSAGARVVSVTLRNGDPINTNQTYRVATNDFLAIGGDGFEMLIGAPEVSYSALDEAVIAYLQTEPVISSGPQGRITAE